MSHLPRSGRNAVPFRPETGDRSQIEGIAQEVALQRQQVLRDDRVIGHMRDSGSGRKVCGRPAAISA